MTDTHFQKRHHGIDIPKKQQPRCQVCNGYMAINISYPNNKCIAFWYCLDNSCSSDFEQVDLRQWLKTASNKIKKHFETVGMSQSQMKAHNLKKDGFILVGGHLWGGGTWGELEGRKAWTGHNGECLEYWKASKEVQKSI